MSREQAAPRRTSSRNRSDSVWTGRGSGTNQQRSGAARQRQPVSPRRPPEARTGRGAARNAAVLQRQAGEGASQVVAVLQDPSTGYEAVAEVLLQARPMTSRWFRRHDLCVALNDLAEAIDPATYANALGQGVADAFIAWGMPTWAAHALAASSVKTLMLAAGAVDPTAQLRLVLRGLILLVCPNLDRCPTCSPVCNTLAGPTVAQQLRFALGA